MSLLRKILLIAIVGLCAGNVEGAFPSAVGAPSPDVAAADLSVSSDDIDTAKTLDFNTLIDDVKKLPKIFQPKTLKSYIFFTIPLSTTATGEKHHIIFPIDGHQPTTEEAGKYACANIDAYNENSPITEWYMQMFGVIPLKIRSKEYYIKAGKAFTCIDGSAPLSQEHVSASLDNILKQVGSLVEKTPLLIAKTSSNFTVNTQIIRTANYPHPISQPFEAVFRTIAADPVGRVLLYRILIEIRRCDAYGNGTCEKAIADNNLLTRRNHCRSLNIHEGDKNSFIILHKSIYFSPSPLTLPVLKKDAVTIASKEQEISADISLLHEMLHWYQYLRFPDRVEDESGDLPRLLDSINYQYLSRCFYDASAFLIWTPYQAKNNEIRVILGSLDPREQALLDMTNIAVYKANRLIPPDYCEGDDLSENAYRVSRFYYACSDLNPEKAILSNGRRKLPNGTSAPAMRWGHSDLTFKEYVDRESLKKFQLANRIARLCFYKICGILVNWRLRTGEGTL